MIENQVIVLNADYSFMNIVSIEKSFLYLAKGKVVIEKYTKKTLTTFGETFIIPKVVRFVYLVRQLFRKKIPWNKRNVCIRDKYVCAYCGVYTKNMTVDHVIPKTLGGKNTFENTVASCKPCNNKKGDKLPKDCGMYPTHKLTQPTISEFMRRWYKTSGIDEIMKSLWNN